VTETIVEAMAAGGRSRRRSTTRICGTCRANVARVREKFHLGAHAVEPLVEFCSLADAGRDTTAKRLPRRSGCATSDAGLVGGRRARNIGMRVSHYSEGGAADGDRHGWMERAGRFATSAKLWLSPRPQGHGPAVSSVGPPSGPRNTVCRARRLPRRRVKRTASVRGACHSRDGHAGQGTRARTYAVADDDMREVVVRRGWPLLISTERDTVSAPRKFAGSRQRSTNRECADSRHG